MACGVVAPCRWGPGCWRPFCPFHHGDGGGQRASLCERLARYWAAEASQGGQAGVQLGFLDCGAGPGAAVAQRGPVQPSGASWMSEAPAQEGWQPPRDERGVPALAESSVMASCVSELMQ